MAAPVPAGLLWRLQSAANGYQHVIDTSIAASQLADEINKIRPPDQQIIIPQIDARLWTHFHTTSWPHHLTKTIMY